MTIMVVNNHSCRVCWPSPRFLRDIVSAAWPERILAIITASPTLSARANRQVNRLTNQRVYHTASETAKQQGWQPAL